jgi:hypothetical protein
MWFNVNFNKLVLLLTPTFLRKDAFLAFVVNIVSGVGSIYNDWFTMRLDNLYKLEHNGQVVYLRKLLNDQLDQSLRRIYIADGNSFARKYIYSNVEQKPKFLGTMFLYSKDDYGDTGVDFIVYVPRDIIYVQYYELKALIDFYKEGVKRYKIEKI